MRFLGAGGKMGFGRQEASSLSLSGGDVVYSILENGIYYNIHEFTATGNSLLEVNGNGNVELLVIAGGGNGGSLFSGGGGAGGLIYEPEYYLEEGTIGLTVGDRGVGQDGSYVGGKSGENSVFGPLVATGGGGGGGANSIAKSGGSGGGGSRNRTGAAGIDGQGTNGGNSNTGSSGAGGGGSLKKGSNTILPAYANKLSGYGGDGREICITGRCKRYAGGGGGSVYNANFTDGYGGEGGGGDGDRIVKYKYSDKSTHGTYSFSNGLVNTGGGGGGDASAGGRGVIILRYQTSNPIEPILEFSPVSQSNLPNIGDFFRGGYYAGMIRRLYEDRWGVLVSPKSSGEFYASYSSDNGVRSSQTHTVVDGELSTQYHRTPGISSPLEINGYRDWYVPARDELELCYRNFKPTTTSNRTNNTDSYRRDIFIDRTHPNQGNEVQDLTGDFHGINRHSWPRGASYTSNNPSQTSLTAFQSNGDHCFSHTGDYWTSSNDISSGQIYTSVVYRQSFNDGYQSYYYFNVYTQIWVQTRVGFIRTVRRFDIDTWTPKKLSDNLVGWWKANKVTSAMHGIPVNRWKSGDYSSRDCDMIVASSATGPEWREKNFVFNDEQMPSVYFYGTENKLYNSTAATMMSGKSGMTVCFVTKPASDGNTMTLFDLRNDTSSIEMINVKRNSSNYIESANLRRTTSDPNGVDVSSADQCLSGDFVSGVLRIDYVGGTARLSLNGGTANSVSLESSGSVAGTVSGTITIGSTTLDGEHFIGDIPEIVVFDKYLTDNEKQKMEGYFAHKWGLTGSLPVSHPYVSSEPSP